MELEKLFGEKEIIFLSYVRVITQSFISASLEVLEKINEECRDINFSNKLYLLFVEVAQNIMHYRCKEKGFKAFISVGQDDEYYYILTENLVKEDDKEKIEGLFKEFIHLDKDEIRKLYREKRRTGENRHSKGGGIGFLEIAKASEKIEFAFNEYEEYYIFKLKIYIKKK